jgi:hypothetical protein
MATKPSLMKRMTKMSKLELCKPLTQSPRKRQGIPGEKGRVVEEDLREQKEELKERKGEVVAKLRKINEMKNEEDLKLKRLVQLRKIEAEVNGKPG